VRRPGLSRAQKQHAREQRALLRLRRAAVKLTNAVDNGVVETDEVHGLEVAAFGYAGALTARERRRLSR